MKALWACCALCPTPSLRLHKKAIGSRSTSPPVISIKLVDSVEAAIAHINRYGSHHTDAILTRDHIHAMQFLREV